MFDVECGYFVAVRNTFGPERGGLSKETELGERENQRSTIIIKRPVCYKKSNENIVRLSPCHRTN